MNISHRFCKFYFGVIIKSIRVCDSLLVDELHFRFKPKQVKQESLYQLIKALDLDYPNDENGKLSLTKIDSKALTSHIEWCIKLIYSNGYTIDFIEAQWNELKQIKD